MIETWFGEFEQDLKVLFVMEAQTGFSWSRIIPISFVLFRYPFSVLKSMDLCWSLSHYWALCLPKKKVNRGLLSHCICFSWSKKAGLPRLQCASIDGSSWIEDLLILVVWVSEMQFAETTGILVWLCSCNATLQAFWLGCALNMRG